MAFMPTDLLPVLSFVLAIISVHQQNDVIGKMHALKMPGN